MPAPPGYREIERQEHGRLFGMMVGARLLLLPALAGLFLWVALIEPAPWRKALLGSAGLLVPLFFVSEAIRYRRSGMTPRAVPLNLGIAVVGQALVTFATGGLASPFLYIMVPLALLVGIFVSRPGQVGLLLFQVAAVGAYAWVAASGVVADFNLSAFGGGPRPGGNTAWLVAEAIGLSVVLSVASGGGAALRRFFDGILRRALAAQQESLEAHAGRAEELTALSAEIAHELKNPLASVKGLAGLLAREPGDAKVAERLAVLRREVDRMQSILEEFLNFSRPLVPLALGRTDVGALCQEVAALHEGLAQERGLGLEVEAGDVPVRCDPRKVKQVLINVLQNALDASPPGSEVRIEAEPLAGGARVRVLDRGRGLDPALAASVFDPGVTTKPRGSGIGLTVARALARQHGGDLALRSRDGGGTVAELTLPADPAGGLGDRAA
ncbi:MAG TPA: HAMP domain-containing sensor histidine kinase [Anaeromyxobacteraceae bacterium]|nr:HAMP domain-containing sensor histidine kinase [Anaeromyxobacteraceae bacterium]